MLLNVRIKRVLESRTLNNCLRAAVRHREGVQGAQRSHPRVRGQAGGVRRARGGAGLPPPDHQHQLSPGVHSRSFFYFFIFLFFLQ